VKLSESMAPRSNPIRVLYVDDSPFDRKLVRDALERDQSGLQVLEASSHEAFEARMAKADFDIVVTDCNVLGFESLRVLDTVQTISPRTPVILLTGTGSEEVAVEAMKRGVADYIVKTPAHIRQLPRTIRNVLRERHYLEVQAAMAHESRESEARFQALVEGALQGIAIASANGIRLFANRAFARIFGYDDPRELIGQEVGRLVAPHERERLEGYRIARLRGEEVPAHYEYRGLRKDGSLIWLQNAVTPVIWGGEPAVQTAVIDITSRKQAEEALQERLRQFDAVRTVALEITRELDLITVLNLIVRRAVELLGVHQAGGAIWLWDDTAQCLSLAAWTQNRAWMRGQRLRLGEGVAGTVAQQRQGLIVNNYANSPYAHPFFVKRTGFKSALVQPLLYHDRLIGTINVSHETQQKPFGARDLDLLALFAAQAAIAIENARLYAEVRQTRDFLVKDITANKRMEQALRHSEARYRTLVEGSIQGISITRGTRLVFANPAFATIFGYEYPEELLGHDWREIVTPHEYARLTAYGQARQRGETAPSRYVFQGRRKDGALIWVETMKTLLWWEGELATLGTSIDITETRRLEQEILQISEHEQQRIGQDLHDDLGQRLTGMAFLGKALTQKLAARSAPEADDAATLNDLLNQALTQTRKLARGLYPMELESQGLQAALQSLAANVEALYGVSCRLREHEAWHAFDHDVAVHLYRIVQEAVINAIKHGQAQHLEISLTERPDSVLLTVRDDGCGFPAAEKQTVGLGLQIMRYRASLLGGELAIQHAAKQGTLVTCQLPKTGP
jgi:PAS domain S-box-containing protein